MEDAGCGRLISSPYRISEVYKEGPDVALEF